ncbi:MAG TPA: DUF2505 domain-containing protein [Actinopolymorphaceae bacterium]|jgi:hypothetical protein
MTGMDLHREMSYPAPLDRVVAMMIDPEFQRQRCESQHALDHTVRVEPEGATYATPRLTVTTRRRLPTDQIPDFVRKFVGATIQLEEIITWLPGDAGSRTAEVRLSVAGAPVTMSGRYTFTADGAGTREVADGTVKASIPFLGGKVEEAVLPVILAGLAAEEKLGAAYLTGSAA